MKNRIIKYLLLLLFTFSFSTSYIFGEEDAVIDDHTVYSEIDNEDITTDTREVTQSRYKCVIEDDADLLTEEQEKRLYDEMMPLTEYGHIMFKSTKDFNNDTASYARSYYHEKFGTESGSLFIIDMYNRQIYIFSDGANYDIITSDKAYSITDNVYRYASFKDYYGCASEAYKQMLTLLSGFKIMEPMRYISNAFIAIILAAFINFFIVMYKSKLKKSSDSEVLKNCKVTFEIGEINVKHVGTRRVYRPPSDSGGSSFGGGGGGFSGGGSSGGGGGHGF